jgi:hypothetical protein
MDEQKFHGGTKIRIDEADTVVGKIKVGVFQMVRQKESPLEVSHIGEKSDYGVTVFTVKRPNRWGLKNLFPNHHVREAKVQSEADVSLVLANKGKISRRYFPRDFSFNGNPYVSDFDGQII